MNIPRYRQQELSSESKSRLPKKAFSLDLSLYLIANRLDFSSEEHFFSQILSSVKGGVSCVQLRDFRSDRGAVLETAKSLKGLLSAKKIPFFLNTPKVLEIAKEVGVDGVYLEEPISILKARQTLGKEAIIGVPVKTLDDVIVMNKTDLIDYISIEVFPSKRAGAQNDYLWGIDGLKTIRKISPHRIIAIGAFDKKSAASLYPILQKCDGIAMEESLLKAKSPHILAKKLRSLR